MSKSTKSRNVIPVVIDPTTGQLISAGVVIYPKDRPAKRSISRYAKAIAKWIGAGRPTRSDDEVRRIYELCRPCRHFNAKKQSCKVCGCRMRRSGTALFNKIRMATESCPRGKW